MKVKTKLFHYVFNRFLRKGGTENVRLSELHLEVRLSFPDRWVKVPLQLETPSWPEVIRLILRAFMSCKKEVEA